MDESCLLQSIKTEIKTSTNSELERFLGIMLTNNGIWSKSAKTLNMRRNNDTNTAFSTQV